MPGRFPQVNRKDADEVQVDYETIFTQSQLEEWMARLSAAPLVSLDTETTSLDPMQAQLIGIAFSVEPHRAAYVPLAHRYAGAPPQLAIDFVLDKLKPWLQDPASSKVGQNLKYDKHVFANHGIALNGIVHDTLLQSYVLEPIVRTIWTTSRCGISMSEPSVTTTSRVRARTG